MNEMLASATDDINPRPRGRTLVVLGNGPSLSSFDFSRFRSFDTIGMNAAYRFWDRIGWYPRYYICLDAVVGQSHKSAIERLIRERNENGIELFVLRKDLVEQFSADLRDDERVMLFEHLRETSKLFAPMPFTTGSHAALVGAQLGYRRIHLMGVDADYVEKIEGAESRGGDVLEIGTTPESNPNYFVKDYQLEGDQYTLPNPIPDLHVKCWREVFEVLKANKVAVWNGSKRSRVDFVPFRSFEDLEAEEGTAAAPTQRDAIWTADFQYDRAAKATVDETAVIADLMADRTGSSHILLDIGAHLGESAIHFDKLGWRIFCFEPDRRSRETLTKRFGKSATVTIDPRAVSDKPAKALPFYASNESSGISGLYAFRDSHRQAATVDATSIADIVDANSLTTADFLKIDVEGHELPVLRGVPWDRFKPDVVVCEFEEERIAALGYSYHDLAGLLVGLGYTVYVSEWHPVLRYGQPHDWCRLRRYPAALLSPQAWGNILAFRVDPGIAALERSFRACLRVEGAGGMLAKVSTNEGRPPTSALQPSNTVAGMSGAGFPENGLVAVSLTGYLKWCKDFLRRRPVVPVAFAIVLIALVATALSPGMASFRPAIWVLLEALAFGWLLLTGLGYTGTLARKVDRSLQRQREAMMDALARSQKQASAADSRLGAVAAELKSAVAGLEKVSGALAQLVNEGKNSATRAEAVNANVAAKFVELSREMKQVEAALASKIAEVSSQLPDISSKLAETSSQLPGLSHMVREAMQVATHAAAAEAALAEKVAGTSRLAEDAKSIAGRADTLGKALLASSSMYNFGRYRAFNRTLTDEQIETLKTVWSQRLSVPADNRALGYAAHRICALESNMHGRLATTIEDILLRSMVGLAVNEKSVSVLEIGTLFGIGAIAVVDALRRDGKALHLTVIDPLESYYGRDKDIVTGQVVSEQVFRDNLRIAGISDADVTVIKSMSGTPEAIEAASKRSYDLLIIDGDHSYDGVKTDFENYAPFVRRGGFIIFDDYGAKDWPDVKQFVDDEMPNHPRFISVGAEWRTSIFRAAKAEEDKPATSAGSTA